MTTPEITTISGIDEVKRHTYLQTDLETQIPHAVVSFDLKQFPAKSEQLAEVNLPLLLALFVFYVCLCLSPSLSLYSFLHEEKLFDWSDI